LPDIDYLTKIVQFRNSTLFYYKFIAIVQSHMYVTCVYVYASIIKLKYFYEIFL